MTTPYEEIVRKLTEAFPQPVSDRMHDSYFVFSILRALDRVDQMKSERPLLGQPEELDYATAQKQRIMTEPSTLEDVSERLVDYLSGLFITGHPRSQVNVMPTPTIPSIIGAMLPTLYNPNLCSDETSRQVMVAEVEATAMTADLVGYPPETSGGLFTFGGTGTILYGARIGLEKACPETGRTGIREPAVIVCSDRAHYACATVAGWLGIGEESVVKIPTTEENDIRTCLLETELRTLLKSGRKIACIVATMGTTDAFGIDDLQEIREIRDRLVDEFSLDYIPHLHADAVIGWAWSVFNDYDLLTNPLEFPPRTLRALAGASRRIQHLGLSDSLGIDFHKTGFTPYVSSLFLVRDAANLQLISRAAEATPYLFQSGSHHPGKYSLETTRSGFGPMAALANLLLFGKNGLRSLLGHLVSMATLLREQLNAYSLTTVLNNENFGSVTLFRVYPPGTDTFSMPRQEQSNPAFREQLQAHNLYNRKIFEQIHAEALQGRGIVISLTDCYRETDYGEPVVALKSYIITPFSEAKYIDAVLESIKQSQKQLAEEEKTD